MKKASIDIGSNSVLLSVCEVEGHILGELVSKANVTSLGRDLDRTGNLSVSGKEKTLEVLASYRKIIETYAISTSHVVVTGTEVLRAAKDAPQFIKEIESVIGAPLTLLTGEGEAHYTAMGVANSSKIDWRDVIIMDMGGASTEFIHFNREKKIIEKSVSLPVGAARSTQWLIDDCFEQKMSEVFSRFDLSDYSCQNLVCVAGSMTTIAAMIAGLNFFDAQELEGLKVERSRFDQFNESIQSLNEEQISKKFPIAASRAQTIKAGAKAAKYLFNKIGVENLIISTYGLRHGTIDVEVIDERFKVRR